MSRDETLSEARRVLGICNVCGYCNGFCDLFEAAKRRQRLVDADLAHLANLCHGCRNCLHACQYAPPHAFAINVPRALSRMRQQSYADSVWPSFLTPLMHNSVTATAMTLLGAIGFLVVVVVSQTPADVLFARHLDAGAFYRILPWSWMLLIGLLPLGWSSLAFAMGLHRYWRTTRTGAAPVTTGALGAALRDVLLMRNLSGGGPGCNDLDEQRFSHARRWLHQTMVLGLTLCFTATLAATHAHHVLGQVAPYPILSLPVVLGTLGGLTMSIGIIGLLWLKWRGDTAPTDSGARSMDHALLNLLLVVALSGLALLIGRASPAMGLLLTLHLGSVLALFVLLPYSKLVHAGYRFIALLNEAVEHHQSRAD